MLLTPSERPSWLRPRRGPNPRPTRGGSSPAPPPRRTGSRNGRSFCRRSCFIKEEDRTSPPWSSTEGLSSEVEESDLQKSCFYKKVLVFLVQKYRNTENSPWRVTGVGERHVTDAKVVEDAEKGQPWGGIKMKDVQQISIFATCCLWRVRPPPR